MDMTYAKSIGASHAAAISNAVDRSSPRVRITPREADLITSPTIEEVTLSFRHQLKRTAHGDGFANILGAGIGADHTEAHRVPQNIRL